MSLALEHVRNNYRKLRVKELAQVIDRWGDTPSKAFRYKRDKSEK